MLLGLETFSYHLAFGRGLMDIFDFIRRTHDLGLDGVQVNIGAGEPKWGHLGHVAPEFLKDVRSLLEELGLYIEMDTQTTDPAYLKQVLDVCQILGVQVLRTYERPSGDLQHDMDTAVANMKQVVPVCEDYGIRIAFENHEYETAHDVIQVIERVGSDVVGALVDNGNGMMVWEDPNETVALLAPYAVSSHLKDHVIIEEAGEHKVAGVALGAGAMDLAGHFQTLVEKSSLERVNIEVCYDYRAPFRRTQDLGAGAVLGQGVFGVLPPPYDPSFIAPSVPFRTEQEDEMMPRWQDLAVEASVAFVKELNKK